ncbi:hypothetical protein BC351_35055 [Paenibacillus ferrarius]|uniref:Transglutaminase-like domain-containing protein n=1 Tax=Paenibacillus ferrarius TaxID=1469647 RepID=A0A1V4HED5_9BACL|nr:transglutaminase domain-containing protein [Paenibacillus ferrarius]OPH51232.1 hypothetical protein BC351_35055 [Paenibacillus ferrarius]
MFTKFKMLVVSSAICLFVLTTSVHAEASSTQAEVNTQPKLEQTIKEELAKKSATITITYTSKDMKDSASYLQGIRDSIDHARETVREDLFWDLKSLSYKMKGSVGNLTITLTPEYLTTAEQDAYVNKEVDRILGDILKPDMSDFQKESAIHDYVVSTTSYEDLGEIGHTAYSALYNHKAVCQGYAILTYKLLAKAGIESHLVVGYLNGDPAQTHMWNQVHIENNWYMLDTVFDDPTPDQPGVQSRAYFNVTNAALKGLGHTWVESDYPIADTLYK